jgi:thiol reductant ABC exporter CydD subunit
VRALDPRLLRRARSARLLLGADTAIGLATAVLVLLQATLLAHVVARAFHGASLADVSLDVALLVAVFAARGALAWASEVAGRRGASKVMSELRLALVRRRLTTQPAALDRAEGGEIAAATVHGLDALEAYFARYLPQVILACIVPVAVLAWVAPIDLESSLIMLFTLPLVPGFMWLIGLYTAQRTQVRWQELKLLSSHFLDVVRGLPTLRATGRAKDQATRIAEISERYRTATMGTLRVSFLSGSVLELAATLGVALVAVTVGVRLVGGGLGLQAGLTVLVLAPELYLPLRRLGAEYHASADGLAVAARILDLLEATPAAVGPGGSGYAPSPARATVRLEHVRFSYPSRSVPVLEDFDLELRPGETVALAGASGAGKSTVAALLLRLLEPDTGRVTADGIDLAGCRTEAWRRELAWVPQHPTLLRGTVAHNIRLGSPSASDEQVRQASALAGADGFIAGLSHGYETFVGDGGRPLSAGERRRIGLARALIRDAPVLILDEPTADLDPASAEVVAEAVERACADRTALLIGHSPGLFERADRVVLLEHGRAMALPALEVA